MGGMLIDSLEYRDSILIVKCSGVFGIGSDGDNPAVRNCYRLRVGASASPNLSVGQNEIRSKCEH